ncbi:hypothetical protein L7F22_064254 [Adiantum nelumboides]|nr:hypothetical protein [Adiantum nelumboides]
MVKRATQKILYMEAGNDFVDILLGFLQLPVATILSIFNGRIDADDEGRGNGAATIMEVGSISNVYERLRKLSDASLVVAKDKLLNPPSALQLSKKNPKLLLPADAGPLSAVPSIGAVLIATAIVIVIVLCLESRANWKIIAIIVVTTTVCVIGDVAPAYKSYSVAWSRGRHFRVDHIDKKRVTFDFGVMAKFEQASRRRVTDQNIVIAKMQYFGLLKEIINADYRSFTILIFDVQWFKVIFYPKPSDERWWYVIEVAPRGARIYENYNLIIVADAEPIETEVAELPDIDMTMPEDDVEPIEIEVVEMPEDDIVDLNDIDFSLGGELTVDLDVGIELCQDAVENT